jgi:fructokinase
LFDCAYEKLFADPKGLRHLLSDRQAAPPRTGTRRVGAEGRVVSFKVVGVGEVLWDLLPGGRQLGGAPANFAYHARALGAEAWVVSRVGRDEQGRELLHRLEQLGLATDAVEEDPAAPTGTVTVELRADGQPHYAIHEGVAWDRIAGEAAGRRAVAAADAVCFGTLAQRGELSRRSIRALLKAAPASSLRILDVNLRQDYYSREILEESLALASVLKVNETELARLAEMLGLPGDERGRVAELARRFRLRVVAHTRGEGGSLLHSRGRWSELPGQAVKVADTVGAGDSFTAALALGLLAGWPLDQVHRRASAVAAYVCSQPGGTPELPEKLRAPYLAA